MEKNQELAERLANLALGTSELRKNDHLEEIADAVIRFQEAGGDRTIGWRTSNAREKVFGLLVNTPCELYTAIELDEGKETLALSTFESLDEYLVFHCDFGHVEEREQCDWGRPVTPWFPEDRIGLAVENEKVRLAYSIVQCASITTERIANRSRRKYIQLWANFLAGIIRYEWGPMGDLFGLYGSKFQFRCETEKYLYVSWGLSHIRRIPKGDGLEDRLRALAESIDKNKRDIPF